MKKTKKRFLSALLACAMIISLFPFAAFASEGDVAKIGNQSYPTLQKAIEVANQQEGADSVTVEIIKSGTYDPFTITRANVKVEAADQVNATVEVSQNKTGNVNGENVTLKGINFVSTDGTTIFSSGNCDNLTLDTCTFTGDGSGTALYIHKPNITINNCTFKDFERGYYTCGDNHAAGKMIFTGNTFDNVRVPIDGYWGKKAVDDQTNIKITGNTFDNGDWDAAYIQLWDYAQYLRWAGNQDEDRNGSAIKATIENNTYNGNVVIYATHFNWLYQSDLTLDKASKALLKKRVLVELENADSATVRNADGSEITAFNENTTSSTRGGKKAIYAICEGDYIFDIKPKNSPEGVISEKVKVQQPTSIDPNGDNTSKVTVSESAIDVAQVGDTKYTTLSEAINAAKNSPDKTVELLSDVSIETWNQIWDVDGLTINGNNHTITVGKVESGSNGNYLFYGAKNLKVSDTTIKFNTNGNGFSMVSGTLDNVKMVGGTSSKYAVFVGASDNASDKVSLNNCTFDHFNVAVYSQPVTIGIGTSNLSVNGSTFRNCDMTMCSYAPSTVFTNNTVNGGSKISFAGAAENADRDNTYTITGNTFQDAGKIWFYGADLGDVTFVKNKVLGNSVVSTEDAKDTTNLNVSENYWGGGAPSDDQLKGNNIVGNDEYYQQSSMNEEDLNTYVPPYTGKYSYAINVANMDNGSVSVDKYATEGEKVTLTVTPDKAYKLDELTVTANGKDVELTDNGDGTYTFTMPSSNVKVSASFVEDKDYVEPDNSITVSMTIGSNDFVINNNIVTVPDAAPYIANDRTYVPFRALGEALGAKVVWDNDARTVTYTLGDTEIVMTIGDTTYTINGVEKSMDVAPEITGDRTYVPVRFVAEGLGFKVTPLYADNGTTASVVFEK